MVLCAGHGTRLRPLTDEVPKPLLPFGDRSFLEHALAAAARAGLTEPVVNTHHLREAFSTQIARLGLELRVVEEPVLRGTAGGVYGARSQLGPGPVVVLNGDAVFDAVPDALAESARDQHLVLAVVPRPRGEGTVGIGEGGAVVRLRGEHFGDEVDGGDYIGLCALGARGLDALPEFGCLIGDFALPLLRRGNRVASLEFRSKVWLPGDDLTGYFLDNLRWLDAVRDGASWVHPSASLAPLVHLSKSLVNAGARVEGRGTLSRCVVMAGAVAQAPLADAIVMPSGRVVSVSAASTGPQGA
jgi:mannose-1-phosphate guanylyltransferase